MEEGRVLDGTDAVAAIQHQLVLQQQAGLMDIMSQHSAHTSPSHSEHSIGDSPR